MKILILSNSYGGMWHFRKELIEKLIENKHQVYLSAPNDQYIDNFIKLGINCIKTNISKHGVNPITDIKLFLFYRSTIKQINPDIVFTYTIKPNVYGGLACQLCKIPYLANVTGLGTAIKNGGILQKISMYLYKKGLKGAKCVFFQNSENHHYMKENGLVTSSTTVLPGSGVNLEYFEYTEYPSDNDGLHFLYVGRIMKDKGIDELLEAAREIKSIYKNVVFDIVGGYDGPYERIIKKAEIEGSIKYHGRQEDVRPFYRSCHCVVLPSYHEGMANVLLEGAAIGRPLITTDIPGCREAVQESINGFLSEVRNSDSLYKTILKILHTEHDKRRTMGLNSRKLMEEKFDRQIIVKHYLNEIQSL